MQCFLLFFFRFSTSGQSAIHYVSIFNEIHGGKAAEKSHTTTKTDFQNEKTTKTNTQN